MNLFEQFIHFDYRLIVGPREAHNPNLDSDQRIVYYACMPVTFITGRLKPEVENLFCR